MLARRRERQLIEEEDRQSSSVPCSNRHVSTRVRAYTCTRTDARMHTHTHTHAHARGRLQRHVSLETGDCRDTCARAGRRCRDTQLSLCRVSGLGLMSLFVYVRTCTTTAQGCGALLTHTHTHTQETHADTRTHTHTHARTRTLQDDGAGLRYARSLPKETQDKALDALRALEPPLPLTVNPKVLVCVRECM